MRILLKILNPFIFLINLFNYLCYTDGYRNNFESYKRHPYNFDKDIKYF
jgi:hypothetical protein